MFGTQIDANVLVKGENKNKLNLEKFKILQVGETVPITRYDESYSDIQGGSDRFDPTTHCLWQPLEPPFKKCKFDNFS